MTAKPDPAPDGDRQERLMGLLGPIHDRARLTARRLCRSNADGDDLFQEAALRALMKLGDLRDEGRFRPWFYAVLLSVHRERSRRSFWRRFVPLGAERQEVAARPALEDARGEAAQLSRALQELPAEQREAVVLFEVDGYTLDEVAELTGSSVAAVKSRLARGRSRLREHYQKIEAADEAGAIPVSPKKELGHG